MAATPGSSDEGEIVENGGGNTAATSVSPLHDSVVDRKDRTRPRYSRSRSSERQNGSRYHSSSSRRDNSPRGQKRPRDDRDSHRPARLGTDPRRFSVRYEDSPRHDYRRSRPAYDDDDRPSNSVTSDLPYDDRDRDRGYGHARARDRSRDRDRHADKRPRNRTRSPYRPPRSDRGQSGRNRRQEVRFVHNGDRDGSGNAKSGYGYDSTSRQVKDDHGPLNPRGAVVESSETPKSDTKSDKETTGNSIPSQSVTEIDSNKDFEEEKPVDEDAEIERRRRRREALLNKSRGATPMLVQVLRPTEKPAASPADTPASTPGVAEGETPKSDVSSPPPRGAQDIMSPAALDIASDQDLRNVHVETVNAEEDGPSAADYDPTADMREDEKRDERRHGHIGPHGQILPSEQKADLVPMDEDAPAAPNDDVDGGDDFDMFAEDFDENKLVAPKPATTGLAGDDRKVPAGADAILEGDDKDGYYKIRIGEIMHGRYQVQSTLGKGMFSGVARAMDITNKKLVAIKMMRNNDALRKGGFTEIAILQKLNDADPENRKHIVKFERHFDYKGHLCLAFENLSLNLREVLRKFGNNVGINLNATRAYAHQIFVALAHMRKCSIIHADLKPDNILVNETRNILKLCDLGTAIDKSDAATAHDEITPYLVSRFYRAPELILGMPYDYAIDTWSIGCTLYELYTGKILFTGDSNNQMLKAIMEIRGKFSAKLYRRGQLAPIHFDDNGSFVSVEQDKVLDKTVVRTLPIVKPTRDIRTRLMAASGGMSDREIRELNHFVDLLDRCLALNPDKRITPAEALRHPFFTANKIIR